MLALAFVAAVALVAPARAQIVASNTLPVPLPSTDWTFCVDEGQQCNFTGTREVRYGANGTFTEPRTFTDGVACHNGIFPDVAPGVRKHCDIRLVGSPSPSPSPDADGDGIPDAQDQCPNLAGPASNNGCPTPDPPPPSGVPAPIAGQGYQKVFGDEFDTYNANVWRKAHYLPDLPAGSVSASGGVLNLNSRRSQGYPDVALSTRGTQHKGPDNRYFRYGYFEVRAKWTPGVGSWPSFWLISNDTQYGVYCPPTSGEIDVFEPQGAEPRVHHMAMHSNSWGNCIPNTIWQSNPDVGFDMTQAYHTYSILWTPDRVRFYLDERLMAERALDGAFTNINQDMNLNLKSSCGGWIGGCTAQSPDVILTQFDYVRVWQQ